MELTIVSLHPSMYEMNGGEQEYRLVYEPAPDRQWIDATTGLDLFGPEHYAMPSSFPLHPPASAARVAYDETSSWERKLGIDLEQYVPEKSVDDGERLKYLYQPKVQEEDKSETEPENEPLSADAYLERKWGDRLRLFRKSAIMVHQEKKTGRLVAFHQLDHEKDSPPLLNREQCWGKAEQFLSIVFPEYVHYLQLENDAEESDREPREREFFYLPVHINGVPVNHERVTISVSTSNGDICTFMGVSYEMIQELSSRSFLPVISQEAAFERYIRHMQLRLKWFLNNDQEVPYYGLLYVPANPSGNETESGKTLRYIDAITGEPIREK